MTLEEAIKLLKQYQGYEPISPDGETLKHAFDLTDETVDTLLTALRPVSREQVVKVWRGNWDVSYDEQNGFTYVTCSKCGDETILNGCFVTTEGEPSGLEDFCSVCGAPMTDEAVEMVVRRLEELHENP